MPPRAPACFFRAASTIVRLMRRARRRRLPRGTVCTNCGSRSRFVAASIPHERKIARTTFRGLVQGWRCVSCGERAFEGVALDRAELLIASQIAQRGPANGETLNFFRTTLGLGEKELAAMLGVQPRTLSSWERGGDSVDRAAWATVAAMIIEAVDDRTDTRDRLDALGSRKARARVVRVDFDA